MQSFPPFSGEAYMNVATIIKSVATGQTIPLSRRIVAQSLFNVLGHLTDQSLNLVGDAPPVLVLTVAEPPDAKTQAAFFESMGAPVDECDVQKAFSIPSWAIPIIMDLIKQFLEGLFKTT